MTKEEATTKIAELLKEARTKLNEATEIADEAGVSFFWDVAYGMGGRYISEKAAREHTWRKEGSPLYEGEDYGWISSSASC